MIKILATAICLCIIALSYIKYKELFTVNTYFSCIWLIIICLNGLNFYDVNPVSRKMWTLVVIAMSGYFTGLILYISKYKYTGKTLQPPATKEEVYAPKQRIIFFSWLYFFLMSMSIVYLIYKTINVIRLLLYGNSFAVIRIMYNLGEDTDLAISPIEVMLRMYFIDPIAYVSLIVLVWIVFKDKHSKTDIIHAVLSAITVLLHSAAYGGRSDFVILIMLIFFSLFIFKRTKIVLHILQKGILTLLIAGMSVFSIVYISLLRSWDYSFLETMAKYFGMSLHLADAYMEHLSFDSERTYGLVYLMGIIRLPVTLFCNFSHFDYPELYRYASNVSVDLQIRETLTSFVKMNAFVTPIFYHYIDAGAFGVFFGFLTYSLLMNYSYTKQKESGGACQETLFYLLMLMTIYYQIIRWQFYRPQYVFAFAYTYLFVLANRKESTKLIQGKEL